VFVGSVALMLPLVAELVSVPIFTGVAKLPFALLNCAVKTFPLLKVISEDVNETVRLDPAQKGVPLIELVNNSGAVGVYSQKSFLKVPSSPVPMYPFDPILKPTASDL